MIFVFHYDQRALTIKLRLSFFFLLTALCFLPPYQILSQSILDRVLLFFFHSLLNFHDAILITGRVSRPVERLRQRIPLPHSRSTHLLHVEIT